MFYTTHLSGLQNSNSKIMLSARLMLGIWAEIQKNKKQIVKQYSP